MDYYKDIDQMDYDQLSAHCRKHQLRAELGDDTANDVFRLAWEAGHSYGNNEVAIHYIDYAELANTVYARTLAQLGQ